MTGYLLQSRNVQQDRGVTGYTPKCFIAYLFYQRPLTVGELRRGEPKGRGKLYASSPTLKTREEAENWLPDCHNDLMNWKEYGE